jgi:nuclear migration protein NUM1
LDTTAAQQGYAVVSLSGLEELHRKAEDPNKQDLDTAASKLGFTLIKSDEIKDVRRKAENPTLDEIKSGSSRFGHELIPNSELEELRRKATSPSKEEIVMAGEGMNLKVIPKEWYEELEKNSTEPDEATIAKFAKRANLSVISVKDLEDLQRKAERPAQEDVEFWGRKLGLVVLTQDQYNVMERASSNRPIVTRDLSSVMAKRDHFEDIIKQSSSPTTKAQHVKVVESIKSLGYVPVSNEEYKRLLDNQNVYEPSRGDILRAAKTYGLVCIGADEYRSLLKKNHNTSQSISSMEALAFDQDSPGSASGRHKSVDLDASFSSLDASPSKAGGASEVVMKTVPAEYLTSLRRIAENPNKDDLSFMAGKLGLVLAPLPEKSIGKIQIPSSIEETVALSTQDYEELSSRASKYDPELVSISPDEYNRLQALEAAEKEHPQSLTVEEVEEYASILGLVTISGTELEDLKEAQAKLPVEPTKEDVEHYAQKFDLVTLPVALYNDFSSRRPPNESLSLEELRTSASNSGMVLVGNDEYKKLTAPQKKEVKTMVLEDRKPLSPEDLKKRAKEIGLVVLSTAEFSKLNTPKEVNGGARSSTSLMDRSLLEVVGSAGTVGDVRGSPVTVTKASSSYNEHTGTFETLDSDVHEAAHRPEPHRFYAAASESNLSESGRDRGVNLPIEEMVGVAPPPTLAGLSAAAAASSATLDKLEGNTGTSYGTPASINTETFGGRTPGSRVDYIAEATANAAAVRAGYGHGIQLSSAATITSQASLNDRNMIAYITQVVIGEFLFKYTRKIGVTGISENRHERFFWIHPYTLTLYWSDDNPAVESSHSQKTRSAAILGVKAIEDHNPLPPGLHHKSLVIQAPGNKELRITCPNRQRHNIWYNSIQYLLKRSTEDLEFEEGEANDDYVQDTRFERERARTSMFQTGRKRVQSIRRSIAPEMNNSRPRASSRQTSIGSFNLLGGRGGNDDASSRASSRLSSRLSTRLSGRMA